MDYKLSLALNGDKLYDGMGTSVKGVYYSVTNGEKWVRMGMREEEPSAFYFGKDGILYFGTGDGQVYHTSNGGKNWELI